MVRKIVLRRKIDWSKVVIPKPPEPEPTPVKTEKIPEETPEEIVETTEETKEVPDNVCPYCGRTFKNAKGVMAHLRYCKKKP